MKSTIVILLSLLVCLVLGGTRQPAAAVVTLNRKIAAISITTSRKVSTSTKSASKVVTLSTSKIVVLPTSKPGPNAKGASTSKTLSTPKASSTSKVSSTSKASTPKASTPKASTPKVSTSKASATSKAIAPTSKVVTLSTSKLATVSIPKAVVLSTLKIIPLVTSKLDGLRTSKIVPFPTSKIIAVSPSKVATLSTSKISSSSSRKSSSTSSTRQTSSSSSSSKSSSKSGAPTSLPNGSGPNNCPASSPPASAGKVQLAGINLSGFDWGCLTDGTCDISAVQSPMKPNFNAGGQMTHFVKDDNFNTFRLPVSWQWLINSKTTASSVLNAGNFGLYDQFVQACLATGAYCIIDIHNYGRFNGAVIGQGGPTNDQFAQLWSAVAVRYAKQPKVIFGLMNEPWGVNITLWTKTLQSVVNAIRTITASNAHTILLPGNDWSGAAQFVTNSGPSLLTITNPDKSFTNLVFDVHKYLDSGSGKNSECISSYMNEAWVPLAQWLRCNGRKALVTETGGGNTLSCIQYMCPVIKFLNANSDVYMGYTGWAAGGMLKSYPLSETPSLLANGTWVDQPLVKSCMLPLK